MIILSRSFTFALFFSLMVTLSYGQAGSSAVPFLLISTSVEANGMGGIMTAANSSSPTSMMFNPAHLGISSQTDFFSTETFSHKSQWLPQFGLSDLWINNYSMMYGVRFSGEKSPNISVGFGYSRVFLNLGRFIVTGEMGPEPLATFDGYETSDNFCVGVGIDLGVTLAFGSTIKKITSQLSPIGTAQEQPTSSANEWASDLGLIVKFPVVSLITKEYEHTINALTPFFDITTAYALNNVGGRVSYLNAAQADPLPRTARLGWAAETGLHYRSEQIDIPLINVTIAREAENLLLKRDNNGSWNYDGLPLGNIDIYNNLIASKANGYISVRRGFSVNVFETAAFRQGSFEGDGNLSYQTSGFSISTRGISKVISASLPAATGFNPIEFFFMHLEIRYSHSEYTGKSPLNGTSFDNLIFTFHH